MDYNYGNGNYNNTENQPPQNTDRTSNGLAIVSLVLGIVSIVLSCCVFGGFLFGALALIFALLSRGKEHKFDGMAIAGIVTSIVGMLLGIAFLILVIVDVAVTSGGKGFESIIQYYEQQLEQQQENPYSNYFNTPDTL